MQPIKLGNFLVGTYQGQIVVGKDDTGKLMHFAPGEIEKVKEIISTALSLEDLRVLPESIDVDHFKVEFHEDDTLTLSAPLRDGNIPFTWREGDELIVRLQDGYNMVMNERQVGAGAMKPITNTIDSGEPFI